VQLGLASWAVPLPPRLATTWRPQRQCGAGLLVLYPVATPMAMMPMVTMMAAAVPVALAATMKHAVHMHSEPTPPGGSSAWPSKQTFVEPPHEERAFKITLIIRYTPLTLQKYRGDARARHVHMYSTVLRTCMAHHACTAYRTCVSPISQAREFHFQIRRYVREKIPLPRRIRRATPTARGATRDRTRARDARSVLSPHTPQSDAIRPPKTTRNAKRSGKCEPTETKVHNENFEI
jgi:hypothetical protein